MSLSHELDLGHSEETEGDTLYQTQDRMSEQDMGSKNDRHSGAGHPRQSGPHREGLVSSPAGAGSGVGIGVPWLQARPYDAMLWKYSR